MALIASRITAEAARGSSPWSPAPTRTTTRSSPGGRPRRSRRSRKLPGNVSLETMLTEIAKLDAVRAIGLPGAVRRCRAEGRGRLAGAGGGGVAVSPAQPSGGDAVTLLAALLHCREREITDTLVELLISTVHRISARAEKKVTEQLINAFKRVSGKENILFKVAEASLGDPGRTGARGGVPGGVRRRGDAAGAGARVQDHGPDLPAHRADHAEGLLHQPLPAPG